MSSERPAKPFWDTLFVRRKTAEAPAPSPATPTAEQPLKIGMPEEQRKVLEQAIPFHRPADQATKPADTQFMFGPLDSTEAPVEAAEAKPRQKPVEAEPYRKKYKKYGRDVCLAGEEGEPYDVLMDNSDNSHRGVDKVSPL